jgi:hypothetical protein
MKFKTGKLLIFRETILPQKKINKKKLKTIENMNKNSKQEKQRKRKKKDTLLSWR